MDGEDELRSAALDELLVQTIAGDGAWRQADGARGWMLRMADGACTAVVAHGSDDASVAAFKQRAGRGWRAVRCGAARGETSAFWKEVMVGEGCWCVVRFFGLHCCVRVRSPESLSMVRMECTCAVPLRMQV